jgi:hypothetical protein
MRELAELIRAVMGSFGENILLSEHPSELAKLLGSREEFLAYLLLKTDLCKTEPEIHREIASAAAKCSDPAFFKTERKSFPKECTAASLELEREMLEVLKLERSVQLHSGTIDSLRRLLARENSPENTSLRLQLDIRSTNG